MAQFTAGGGGRSKSLFSRDGWPVGFGSSFHRLRVASFGGCQGFTYSFSVPRGEKRIKMWIVRALTADASGSSFTSAANTWGDNVDEILNDDMDFEIDELAGFRGLVLDISYRPVNVVCWKRAICLEFMDKADVLEYYDQTISSPSGSFYIPAVLRVPHLLQVKRRRVKRNLSRKNVFHRDNYMCQYCSSHESLTIDHVLPISRGGLWTWENLVAACAKCNSKKGQKTMEEANMKLMKTPKAPKEYDILTIPLTNHTVRMLRMRKGMPEEWRQYLSNQGPLP